MLVVSNHVSYLDPPFIISVLIDRYPDEIVRAPAKAELFSLAGFDRLLTSLGAFPVQRTGRDLRVLRRMTQVLRRQKMLLYPEGGRSLSGSLEVGVRAVGRVVLEAKPIVIPAAILGTERVLSPRMKLPRLFQRLQVRFGAPLAWEPPAHLSRKEAAQYVTDRLMEGIRRLLEAPPEAHRGSRAAQAAPQARPGQAPQGVQSTQAAAGGARAAQGEALAAGPTDDGRLRYHHAGSGS